MEIHFHYIRGTRDGLGRRPNMKTSFARIMNPSRFIKTSGSSSTFPGIQQPRLSGLSLPVKASSFRLPLPTYPRTVLGKTGVGKSSLISDAFGVEKEIVAHDKPGDATIDDEFISSQNDRSVLHDSKGFEPGDEDNLKIVQDFVGPDLAARAIGRSERDGFVVG
ncbi:uncharacterized protein HD556DRAFT_194633 [Suillus plorans]|uniref:G domain-containing protein n=1 Tax=Suillus plorans TaxID=116603 RepID=A0A9P7DMR0_9AGAM|nr:uncharacterized protein HD556DRAFT_194633 [Suillus plorans]KAG1798603.1 hypothetical protein HD556DRAFT_194633 [Suillus plorans]